MKKITLIMFSLVATIGFSQNLVTNGDFQLGTGPNLGGWYGNASNAVHLGGGNNFNQAEVTASGPAYTVNLSQEILIDNEKTYKLTFDAFTDTTTGSRTMVVGLGQTGSPWGSLTQTTTLTSDSQTFVYQFTINYGDAVTDRVIFDMGADVGFVFIDNVIVEEVVNTCGNGVQDGDETGVDCGGLCSPCINPPSVAAPTPPERAVSDVISVYSDAYTDPSSLVSYSNFDAGWCNGAAVTGVSIANNNVLRKNQGSDCHGIDFAGDKKDLSGFTHLHFDFYTTDTDLTGDVFNVKLVDFGGGTAEASALEVNINGGTTPQLVAEQWVSVDVDITSLGGVVANNLTRTDIAQIGITTANVSNVWYDNIYFHKNTTLSANDFEKSEFSAYPNPTRDDWTIKSKNNTILTIDVFDVLGKNVRSLTPNKGFVKLGTSDLKSGLYFARVTTKNGTSSIKLIKN